MEAKRKVLELCKNDLIYFGKVISPQVFYLKSAPFHYELSSLIMDKGIKQLVIQAPRGVGKSQLCKLQVLHHAIFDEGNKLIVIQSKTRKEAVNRLSDIKDILNYNEIFKDLFGYCGVNVAKVWREDHLVTTINGWTVSIFALGTGQPVRGTLKDDTRITLYILDDPDDEDSTVTNEQMDKNFDKFLGGIAGLDRRNGRAIVIGTPVKRGCIVDRISNTTGWTTKILSCIDDNNNLLWEEMYPRQWLEKKKEELEEQGMLRKFYSEYMCSIQGEEEQLFKPEYLRYWDGYLESKNTLCITSIDDVELPNPKRIAVNIFLGIDPASSVSTKADYSVTMTIAYDGDNIYVLNYFRNRVTPTEHAEQIINEIKTKHPTRAQVESVGYQEMLRQYLRKRMEEENIWVSGLETKITQRVDKVSRLSSLHHFFVRKKVYLKKDMVAFKNELATFPYCKHDDLLDGFYYATMKLVAPDIILENDEDDDKYFAFNYYQPQNRWLGV